MRFQHHHLEAPPRRLKKIAKRYQGADHLTAVWNAFVDSELSGINDDDCAIFPRILPGSYLPIIRRTAREITTFALSLLSLPESEIRAIVPAGPVRDFLIDELEVLKHRTGRLTGSFRFDMAIVGTPGPANPPKLLEINEIGFDGLARSSFIQKTLLSLMPELRKQVFALDTAAAEVRNMMRLGSAIARFQSDCYNWDEEYLLRTARRLGADVQLVAPAQFNYKIDASAFPLLLQAPVVIDRSGRVRIGKNLAPDAIQMSFAFGLDDYKKGRDLYRRLVRARTPQYGPFVTGLVASKMILVLLNDAGLRRKLLGSSRHLGQAILPASPLKGHRERVLANADELVLKHTDGFGGEQVYLEQDLLKQLRRIKSREEGHWVAQERTRLNTIRARGILSKERRVITDLGVFVHYDWAGGRFENFSVGGFITRATNKSFKVNVSGGGIQVPVMFDRRS